VEDRDELRAWLTLIDAPGLPRSAARRLLAATGGASEAVRSMASLREHPVDELCTRTLAWLGAAPGRRIVTLGDAEYPPQLLESPDPPLLLHLQGRVELLRAESVAVVGTRHPTAAGAQTARDLSRALGEAGFAVVSGLALGIDAAAHEGALAAPAGTIAVVGTGLDRVYPQRNLALAHRIAEAGLLVSEYPLGTPPLPAYFPQRNRIIAGLARGTLVVEAALRSGSLITARLAAEAGREVFAVPGSIHAPLSRGCHALIQQGAKLVLGVDDILDELRPVGRARPATAAAPEQAPEAPDDPLLAALGFDPVGVDEIAARTGLDAATLAARLLDLELDGRIARLPGGLFQRLSRA
jgi:DNA processing protein